MMSDLPEAPLRRRLLFLLLLLAVTLPVYGSTIDRFFAADQIRYFDEVRNDFRLSSTLRLWDYGAARRAGKGDDPLFRPLTHLLLATETSFFGYHYRSWNLFHLGLHLTVCLLLFELLWTLHPSRFAAAGALLFAVLTANFELAVWNHLSGYLLGDTLFLVSLLAVLRLTRPAATDDRRRWGIVLALTAFGAACCHEIFVVGAAATAAFVLQRRRREEGRIAGSELAVLLAPLALYAMLYAGHAARCERWLWMDHRGPAPPPLALRIIHTLGLWSWKAWDPWSAEFLLRNCDRFAWAKESTAGAAPRALLLVVLAVGLAACLRPGLTRDRLRERAAWVLLLAALLAAYSAMVNFGRAYASDVTYYGYFFTLIAAALVYSLVDFGRVGRRPALIALVLLLGLSSANALRTFGTARRLAALNAPAIEYFDTLEKFVRDHREEPGFAFAVRAPDAADPSSYYWKGYPDHPPDDEKTVSELLYPAYFDPALFKTGPDPARHKYVLLWNPPGSK